MCVSGYWIFHCHIEFHVELGMALVFKVGDHADFPPVPKGFPRCGSYNPMGPPEATTTAAPTTTISYPTTTVDDTQDNEVEREKVTITKWLPLIIRELTKERATSSSAVLTPQILLANACLVLMNVFR